MKALILHVFFLIAVLTFSSLALAEDPVDLVALQELGLSPEIIGRYLAQNLDSTRVAPPIEADLIARLGEYGGDELVGSYLNLDKQTAHLQRRDFSPQVVEQLLAGDVGADKLKNVLDGEAAAAARVAAEVPAPAAVPALSMPEVAETVTESELSPPLAAVEAVPPAPMIPTIPPAPVQALSVPEPPVLAAPVSSAPSAPQAVLPAIPQAAAPAAPQNGAPVVQAPPAAAPQRRFQDLRPGQAADPASKLPPPLDTYEIRQPASGGGPVMGVTERELADGHRVEVNILGDPGMVGQEVVTRPSGRKVYRYHSGNTGRPAPISDPAQERRNREDLQIIHGGSQ